MPGAARIYTTAGDPGKLVQCVASEKVVTR